MKDLSNVAAIVVDAEGGDQRIDNFLMRHCKGVPRSHIYRILRTGEVRVNSRRVDATYRVQAGDKVRVPPIRIAQRTEGGARKATGLELPVIYEDEAFIAVDKPAGIAVHGGSGVAFGVIERLRAARPEARFLELVHRLDRETSGLLLIAKRRSALKVLHEALREGKVAKRYLALAQGVFRADKRRVNAPLRKYLTAGGERRVSVDADDGKESATVFRKQRAYTDCTLLSAELETGRTHQIRVHLAHLGHPIAGDDKYGDFAWNRELSRNGLKRMFLHAAELDVEHPLTGEPIRLRAPLSPELSGYLERIESSSRGAGEHSRHARAAGSARRPAASRDAKQDGK